MNEQKVSELYFGCANTWADDLRANETRSRNRYQAAFFASMGLNVITAIAVCVLANYQTVVPLLVNHYDNGVTVVSALSEKKAITNQSQIESDLVRYVLHREAFDETSYRAQYELVTLLSNNTTAQE